MANGSDEVKSLLKDVSLYGSVVINKKKLLWLLGWGQDRAGAWKDLLSHWAAIGEQSDKLSGFEVYDNIILSVFQNKSPEKVSKWASNQN